MSRRNLVLVNLVLKLNEHDHLFDQTDELYKSYVEFNLKQDGCLKKIREYSNSYNEYKKDDPKRNFKTYLEVWNQANTYFFAKLS